MHRSRQRVKHMPDGCVAAGPEHFTGMQDFGLRMSPDDPRWASIKGSEEHTGNLRIDTTNLPDLVGHPDPRAMEVMRALYALGAFD